MIFLHCLDWKKDVCHFDEKMFRQTKKVFLKIAKKVKRVKEALDYAGHNSLPFCGIFWRKKIVTFLDFLQS
jgi:hypothetical protein